MPVKQWEKFWEEYFNYYDYLNLLIPYKELLSFLCSELDIKNKDLILEAGCGTGNLAILIRENGGNVIGIDNCDAALKIYESKDSDAQTINANILEVLPFENNYFDKIVSNNTLYSIDRKDQPLVLKELYRVLKPGGKILLSNPLIGGNPIKIYINHFKKSLETMGAIKTFKDLTLMIIPTIKIFWYNIKIKKVYGYSFFAINDQKKLLNDAGFINLSQTKLAYAKQNIVNSGIKPKND